MTRHARRLVAALVLTAYVVGLAALLLWPSGTDINRLNVDLYVFLLRRGAPHWLTPPWYAAALNVLLLAPLTCVATLVVERVPWWVWALAGGLLSLAVEAAQATLVPGRVASWADVAANTAGAVLGALVGLWLRRRGPGRTAPG